MLLGGAGCGSCAACSRRLAAGAHACISAARLMALQGVQSCAASSATAAALVHIPAEQGKQAELEDGQAPGARAACLPVGALIQREEVGA